MDFFFFQCSILLSKQEDLIDRQFTFHPVKACFMAPPCFFYIKVKLPGSDKHRNVAKSVEI